MSILDVPYETFTEYILPHITVDEVADRNWGYVKWCMAQQNPSEHLIWFLRQAERYKSAQRKHDLLEALQWETYKGNSSSHPIPD